MFVWNGSAASPDDERDVMKIEITERGLDEVKGEDEKCQKQFEEEHDKA